MVLDEFAPGFDVEFGHDDALEAKVDALVDQTG